MSEIYVRPISDLLLDKSPRARTSFHTTPVVRFKDVDVEDTSTSPSMTEDDPSYYDSDASQASVSSPRRRRRRAAPRKSTAYLVALPAPKLASKKTLFKTIRPRLLLQLQQLAAHQRPRPNIDVFPASLIAGPLVMARYIHCFPRLFGVKRELGPRDLILVKSEDYTANAEEEDENSNARRQPVAVLSPGRGQGTVGEIVLDDGSIWTCSSQKGFYSFVHVDESGASLTVRWVKRNPAKRASSQPASRPESQAISSAPFSAVGDPTVEPDYRYTFSIINPLSRRHPILATLTPQSMEIYDDYTTPSSSSGRYPPTRPVSGAFDSVGSSSRSPILSPLSVDEPSIQRKTHSVDEDTQKLIMVTGLWLALLLGPAPSSTDIGESAPASASVSASVSASCTQESPLIRHASTFPARLPRRQTMSTTASQTPPPLHPRGLRRAVSTGAAFIQRRRQKESSETPSSTAVDMGRMTIMEMANDDGSETDAATTAGAAANAAATCPVLQKQIRRLSWFKKLTH